MLILMENWGDTNYMGFEGIEIFDKNGKKVKITKVK